VVCNSARSRRSVRLLMARGGRGGGGGGASLGVVGLDGRELVHAVDEGCDAGVGVEHGGRDAVEAAPGLEHAEQREHGAVGDGGGAAAEKPSSWRHRVSVNASEYGSGRM
jgi:hypothetical protein